MIHLHLSIDNPWHKDKFDNLWHKSFLPTKHKHVEMEVIRSDYTLFKIGFSLSHRTDHAGLRFNIGLLMHEFDFTLYDSRHWNTEKGAWDSKLK